MKIIEGKEQDYQDYKDKNTDPYGNCVIQFSEAWANLMEEKIKAGEKLENIAKESSHQADKDFGITGFMYGCAASALSHFWIHGESLRRWHNLDTQIGNEGEIANEKGDILNPALISIEINK